MCRAKSAEKLRWTSHKLCWFPSEVIDEPTTVYSSNYEFPEMAEPTNSSNVPAISEMPFQYDTLPNGHSFRVLLLKPGNDHDTLRGSLITRSMKNPPSYQALSYLWGSAKQTELLECDYQDFKITASLNTALRRIRSPHDCIFVWADQVCINQRDNAERSQQVSMMRDIYSGADIVSAWLGPGNPEEIKFAAEAIIGLAYQTLFRSKDPPVFPQDEELREYRLPIRSSPVWAAFDSLIRLPYFSRIWIIQEVVVSRAFRLLWGDFEIPGDLFTQGLENAARNGMNSQGLESSGPRLDLQRLECILWRTENEPGDLLNLILATFRHQATDGRDKIFALIGLSNDGGIVPDYDQTETSLFKDFALQEIMRSGLKILSYVYVTDPTQDTKPFWVPRWHASNKKILTTSLVGRNFNASNRHDMIRDTTSDSQLLVLKGIHIDEVEDVSCQFTYDDPGIIPAILSCFEVVTRNEGLFQTNRGAYTSFFDETFQPFKDDTYIDSFMLMAIKVPLTMIIDSEDNRDVLVPLLPLLQAAMDASPSITTGTPSSLAERYEPLRAVFEEMFPHNPEQASSYFNICKIVLGISREQGDPQRWRFKRSFSACVPNRRFFMTKTGYIGLGPSCMEPGDSVCILFGGTTSYVIRPTSTVDEYLFLGDSYVHGIMEGEAMTMYEAQEIPEEQQLMEKWFRLI
ncbi:hypothetical protein BOTNAR_0335g00040 [Botryotinia narcissicola]|uniref:Heterokaryon incompatibility domain-containing protein n=1 Tax=Botryotinia narcissicola TaxID=278944 RepID=A0A4Z1I596_9HELO|nr:hypothetical protein BOTNAR_0335g00040 [Botryotinia narcissicola]